MFDVPTYETQEVLLVASGVPGIEQRHVEVSAILDVCYTVVLTHRYKAHMCTGQCAMRSKPVTGTSVLTAVLR